MNSLPFRIKVGVTGHRENLPDTDILKAKIREVLGLEAWENYKKVIPNSIFSLFDYTPTTFFEEVSNSAIVFNRNMNVAKKSYGIFVDAVFEVGPKFDDI